jgi:EAL and modified HD-GYP domain-containing signal transduction protein
VLCLKILRIVPLFRRDRGVEAYIPHLIGFTAEEELELLRKVDRAIPKKMWAFAEQSVPDGYTGVLVPQDGSKERIAALREAGLEIVGYNLKLEPGVRDLMESCAAVAVDRLYGQFNQFDALLRIYGSKNIKRIVLSVNTLADYDALWKEGFDYFIGDFYTKSVLGDGGIYEKLNPVKANQIALLAEVSTWHDDDTGQDLRKMAGIIERDVALTLSILKLSNSAAYGGRQQIGNVYDAIVRVGTANLKRWAISHLTGAVTDRETPEIARVALLRAKFMENLAKTDKWLAFFAGLASATGVMLGLPREEALNELNAPQPVRDALQYNGTLGAVYGAAEAYINGEDERLLAHAAALDPAEPLYLAYLDAELWVTDLLSQLDSDN